MLSLSTDTSDTHIGGVLQQLAGGSWQTLTFYSKKLSTGSCWPPSVQSDTSDSYWKGDGFACSLTTSHWSHLCSAPCHPGRPANSESCPSSPNLHRTSDRPLLTAAQQPPTAQLISPAPTAKDWPEEGLVTPERPILAAIAEAQAVDFLAMAAAQRSFQEVAEMINSTTLQITTQAAGNDSLLRDVSTGVFRPLVPIQCREAVFQSLHSIHHPGVQATRRLIAARFCWPQMAQAITLMARTCLFCQQGKVHKHVHLQPAEIPLPHRRFTHIHVDLVGPLLPSRGHTYLFTIIDRTSRWPEAIPLSSITAADCARALFASWASWIGVPATITSDGGAQFTSPLWAGLWSLRNIQHSPTTAYHPQSNRLVEWFHRWLKDALRSRAAAADWHDHLPWVMLGMRASFREDSKFSPAEAVFCSHN